MSVKYGIPPFGSLVGESKKPPEAEIRKKRRTSVAGRLRITYRDKAKTAGSSNGFGMNVNVKIDGVSITPLITMFDAENSPFANSTTPFFSISSPFTTVGSVSGIAAGTHTLTSEYIRVNTANAPVVCFVTNNPYFIEIEEIP